MQYNLSSPRSSKTAALTASFALGLVLLMALEPALAQQSGSPFPTITPPSGGNANNPVGNFWGMVSYVLKGIVLAAGVYFALGPVAAVVGKYREINARNGDMGDILPSLGFATVIVAGAVIIGVFAWQAINTTITY